LVWVIIMIWICQIRQLGGRDNKWMCQWKTHSYMHLCSTINHSRMITDDNGAYTVSQKNDTDVAHNFRTSVSNFKAHRPILIILGRNAAEWVCYRTVICCHTSHNVCAVPGETRTKKLRLFSHAMSQKCHCFGLLYLRLLSTNFNNFWHILSVKLALSKAYLISHVCSLLCP